MKKFDTQASVPKLKPRGLNEEFGFRLMVFFIAVSLLMYSQFHFEKYVLMGTDYFRAPQYFIVGMTLASFFFLSLLFSLLNVQWQVRTFGLLGTVSVMVIAAQFGGVLEKYAVKDYVLAAPAMALSMALPFLLARYLLGWQFVFASWDREQKRQFVSVFSLFVLVSVVAFCVFGVQKCGNFYPLVICAIFFGVGSIVVLPYLFLMMRTPKIGFYFWLTSLLALLFSWGPPGIVTFGVVWLGVGLVALRYLGCSLVLNREIDSPKVEFKSSKVDFGVESSEH